jgi:hypothetical protein
VGWKSNKEFKSLFGKDSVLIPARINNPKKDFRRKPQFLQATSEELPGGEQSDD